jgi:hypothetical protein
MALLEWDIAIAMADRIWELRIMGELRHRLLQNQIQRFDQEMSANESIEE